MNPSLILTLLITHLLCAAFELLEMALWFSLGPIAAGRSSAKRRGTGLVECFYKIRGVQAAAAQAHPFRGQAAQQGAARLVDHRDIAQKHLDRLARRYRLSAAFLNDLEVIARQPPVDCEDSA
jgi:hypothetical protein